MALDIGEGADMVMIKPALAYLDVIRRVADSVTVPVAAYQVSGEFAMVEAAAANGWLDRDRIISETLTAIRRAGASVILTYWAAEVARGWQRDCATVTVRSVIARAMSRTACASCPTIGNRDYRAVIPSSRSVSAVSARAGRAGPTVGQSRAAANGRSGRSPMVDVVRRRGRGRGRAAERHQPLGDVAAQYASMGWPVCVGAHPYRGTRAAMEPGRACSCDRVGCPAPGAHPVSPPGRCRRR